MIDAPIANRRRSSSLQPHYSFTSMPSTVDRGRLIFNGASREGPSTVGVSVRVGVAGARAAIVIVGVTHGAAGSVGAGDCIIATRASQRKRQFSPYTAPGSCTSRALTSLSRTSAPT